MNRKAIEAHCRMEDMNAEWNQIPRVLVSFAMGLLLFVAGCSSISVQPKSAADGSSAVPRRIVVAPFTFAAEADRVRVDRTGQDLRDFKRNLTTKMSDDLVEALDRFGLPVEHANQTKAVRGPRGWIVQGQFTRVNQGSRALRIIVGLGAGGTKMETRVNVIDSETGQTVFDFRTTGGSNIDTGLITSSGPISVASGGGALLGVLLTVGEGVTDDAHRTAKMIADYISQQLASRGAIPRSKARAPKILNGPVDPWGSLRN